MQPDLSIIVCIFDEEENIERFIDAVDGVIPSLGVAGHEIIFVDDGSTDSSWKVVSSLADSRNDIVALRLLRNVGKENALAAGLAAASGRAHVPMDVDLQDPPIVLAELVKHWQQGADNVLARREKRHDSWIRRLGGSIVYRTLALGGDIEIPRDVSDFRLMSEETTHRFLALPERNRYNKGLFALVSGEAAVVNYERPSSRASDPRGPRQSLRKLIQLATSGLVSFSTWPLLLLSVTGFMILGLSFVVAILAVVLRLLDILEVPGQTTVVVLFAFLLGFQALSIGILGLYVGQVLQEVKRRPLFAVDESLGLDHRSKLRVEAAATGPPELGGSD